MKHGVDGIRSQVIATSLPPHDFKQLKVSWHPNIKHTISPLPFSCCTSQIAFASTTPVTDQIVQKNHVK